MKLTDLIPNGDVKGGAPTLSRSHIENTDSVEQVSYGVSPVWRTVSVAAMTALVSGFIAFISIGSDNVKHSEVDSIMSTRAPYIHDKQRIQEKLTSLEDRVNKLESIARDDFDKRIRDLEQKK